MGEYFRTHHVIVVCSHIEFSKLLFLNDAHQVRELHDNRQELLHGVGEFHIHVFSRKMEYRFFQPAEGAERKE